MSSKETENSAVYKQVLAATQDIDPPSVGFEKADGSIGPTTSKLIKQNNFIIQLLVKTFEEVISLRIDIEILSSRVVSSKEKQQVSDLDESIETLQHQLEKLTLKIESEPEKPKKKTAPFFVYKDPLQIYKEEIAKLRK